MKSRQAIMIGCVALAGALWPLAAGAQQIQKSEPPLGELRAGQKVLVDNGKCPKGQVQEVTGGVGGAGRGAIQRTRGESRTRTCVKRPG